MKHTTNAGFSIILAMGIVLLLSMIWLYLMEYMVPFSRSVKWIENASQAFYESYAWVEESVLKVYDGALWSDYSKSFWDVQDYEYNFTGSWTYIPAPWQWNAPNDANYSRFSQSEPISLEIWNGKFDISGETIDLFLQVPNGVDFDNPYNDEIILLQLSGDGWSLSSASGALITESDVRAGVIDIFNQVWVDLTWRDELSPWIPLRFRNYFEELWCQNTTTQCVLKAAIIRPLKSDSGDAIIPYLEYRFETSKSVPYPNPLVISKWKSYQFSKTLEVFIPQQATSSAFDFTVLQ